MAAPSDDRGTMQHQPGGGNSLDPNTYYASQGWQQLSDGYWYRRGDATPYAYPFGQNGEPLDPNGGGGGGSGFPVIFKKLVNPIPGTNVSPLQLGGNVLGSIIQARQTSKAVQAQTDAANRALDLSRDVYLQQRSDLSPYRSIGNGATSTLANLMGIPMTDTPAVGGFAQPTLSQLGSARTPSSGTAVPRGSTVLMEAPNGQRQAVSADQVNHYTQLGARVVG